MNYELAKRLMEAGFPQAGRGKPVAPLEKIVVRQDDFVYAPTIEELLAACGYEMITLCGKQGGPWIAMYGDAIREAETEGATAEEALGLLWLALNPTSYTGETDRREN